MKNDRHRKPADGRNSQTDEQVKVRACLLCRRPFRSQWAGERICRNCKSTAAWRSGAY
jgi:hypothetical protein